MRIRPGIRIVDLGGLPELWNTLADVTGLVLGRSLHVTLVNHEAELTNARTSTNEDSFTWVSADVTATGLLAHERFDIAFSNSVVEHVGNATQQRAFATNVLRPGPGVVGPEPRSALPHRGPHQPAGLLGLASGLAPRHAAPMANQLPLVVPPDAVDPTNLPRASTRAAAKQRHLRRTHPRLAEEQRRLSPVGRSGRALSRG